MTDRKTGRPRVLESVQRSEVVATRLTIEEAATVRAEAEKAGLSVSDYCRRVILKHRVRPAITDTDAAALADLNRVGVNLNQIARTVNRGQGIPVDLADTLAEVRAVIEKLAGGEK